MRITCLLFLLGISGVAVAQDSSATLSSLDSLTLLQNLRSLLDSADKPSSYALVSVGVGNRLFSINNKALNTKQSTTSTLIYSPSIAYMHKSGFSFSAAANMLNDPASGFEATQFSLSPAFELQGNHAIGFSFSYTHYFVKDSYSPYASPIQNDFYSAVSYRKTWLKPALALGYSFGKYNELRTKDTLNRRFYDSVTNNLTSFSAMLMCSHSFDWYQWLGKNDAVSFTPTVMVNFANSSTSITHNTNAVNLLNFLARRNKLPKLQSTDFRAESVGLDINFIYQYGRFSIEPDLYMDYYLPETDTNRFTSVFSCTLGYTL